MTTSNEMMLNQQIIVC